MSSRDLDVITIRGAPGTGKTRTAKRLARHYPGGVRLEIDSLRSMVISVEWTNQNQHADALSLSTDLVQGFLRQGYRPVIVVDTFSGDKLGRYLRDLHRLDETLVVESFALVTDAEELKRRLESRPPDEFKDFEVSDEINSHTLNHRHPSEAMIDTTSLKPEDTAQRILQRLDCRGSERA